MIRQVRSHQKGEKCLKHEVRVPRGAAGIKKLRGEQKRKEKTSKGQDFPDTPSRQQRR